MSEGLELTGKREFAKCPKCEQLIDSSVEVCRFCGSSLQKDEIQKAAAIQTALTLAKARENNRRALIAGIIGLAGTVLLYALWYGRKFWIRFQRQRP